MELEFEVVPYHVEMSCDVCTTGRMIPIPFEQTLLLWRGGSQPDATYPHVCNTPGCENRQTYKERYPLLRHKFKGQ